MGRIGITRIVLSMIADNELKAKILQGDVRDVLKRLPDNHVQMVITSPPYFGLRAYPIPPVIWDGDPACEHNWEQYDLKGITGGTASPKVHVGDRENFQIVPKQSQAFCAKCAAWLGQLGQEPQLDLYVKHLVDIFREVRRVLKPDGTLWLNIGDSFAGSGRGLMGDKSQAPRAGAKQATNTGTTVQGIVKASVPNGCKPQDIMMVPATLAMALRADGWWLRSEIWWHKPNGFCESVRNRPTRVSERIYLLSAGYPYYWDREAAKEPAVGNASGNKARKGNHQPDGRSGFATGVPWFGSETRNIRDVWFLDDEFPSADLWSVNTEPASMKHFAAFPFEVAARCIRIGSKLGDTVLDPFSGTGRSGIAALRHDRGFIGIEMGDEFVTRSREILATVIKGKNNASVLLDM